MRDIEVIRRRQVGQCWVGSCSRHRPQILECPQLSSESRCRSMHTTHRGLRVAMFVLGLRAILGADKYGFQDGGRSGVSEGDICAFRLSRRRG